MITSLGIKVGFQVLVPRFGTKVNIKVGYKGCVPDMGSKVGSGCPRQKFVVFVVVGEVLVLYRMFVPIVVVMEHKEIL